jgi:hypothetical protein
LRRGRAEAAADALSRVLRLARESGDIVGEAFALASLGNARRMLGDFAGAEDVLSAALALAGHADNRLIHGRSLLGLAELHLAEDEEHAALARVEEAIAVFHEHGAKGVWPARALELLGRIHERVGLPAVAAHAQGVPQVVSASHDGVPTPRILSRG